MTSGYVVWHLTSCPPTVLPSSPVNGTSRATTRSVYADVHACPEYRCGLSCRGGPRDCADHATNRDLRRLPVPVVCRRRPGQRVDAEGLVCRRGRESHSDDWRRVSG